MVEYLNFTLKLKRDSQFSLDAKGQIPLQGISAIVGPSGSGKTTLLRCLAGLEDPDSADVTFRGEAWEGVGYIPPEARRIGFVFQSPGLFDHRNVAGNISYGAKRRDVTSYGAILDALNLRPLLERRVRSLSGGEARRVALGRALASNPAILFMDEPLVGLDQGVKSEFLPYIARAVREAQVPAIYVTHASDEVTTLADRVLEMSKGRLVGWRTPPMRLCGSVILVEGNEMRVRLDGAKPTDQDCELILPVMAHQGERIGLGLPEDGVLISESRPGRSSAIAVFPGLVVEANGGLALSVFGQRLRLPMTAPKDVGANLWLSVLRVLPRPESGDSEKSF